MEIHSDSSRQSPGDQSHAVDLNQALPVWKDLRDFLLMRGHRRDYFSRNIEEGYVFAIAGAVYLGGILSNEAVQSVPSDRGLYSSRESCPEAERIKSSIAHNPLLRLFIGQDKNREKIINQMLRLPAIGDALRYYYLETTPDEKVYRSMFKKDPVQEYPEEAILFGGGFIPFMRRMCSSSIPSVTTDDNLTRTCRYQPHEAKKFEVKMRVPLFDISAITRRRIRALIHCGVEPSEPLARYVACSGLIVGARQQLHELLMKKLNYLFTISPYFTSSSSRSPSSYQSFIRSSFHNGILEASHRLRLSKKEMDELVGEVRETYGLIDEKSIHRLNSLLYHRPSQVSDSSKIIGRLASYWTYRQAIEAVHTKKPDELEFIASTFFLTSGRAVALTKDKVKLVNGESDQMPNTGTIVAALMAPRDSLVSALLSMSAAKRVTILNAMAEELTALLGNFESVEFAEPVSEEISERIYSNLIDKIEYLSEIAEEVSEAKVQLRRPQTIRDEIQDKARSLISDRSQDDEIIGWFEDKFKTRYKDERSGDFLTPQRIVFTATGRPTLVVERFSDFDIKDSSINPWQFRLKCEAGIIMESPRN